MDKKTIIKRVVVPMSDEDHSQLKIYAAKSRKPIYQICVECINHSLDGKVKIGLVK